jgi:hypothetical protein
VDVNGPDGDALRALVREVLSELLPAEVEVGGRRGHTSSAHRTPSTHTPGVLSAGTPGVLSAGTPGAWPEGAGGGSPVDDHAVGRPGLGQGGLAHTVRENVEAVETVSLRTDADLDAFVRRLLRLFENPQRRDALRAGRLRFRLAAAAGPGSVQPAHRVDKGAVTEAMVRQAARAGARLVLGRRAVLTPLARDRARAAGVEIERER